MFAHYFPPYPISLDNAEPFADTYETEYLSIDGEKGIHQSYGGLLRDRPESRAPLTDPQWRQRDLETEVRNAISAGIDGFSVDIMTRATDTDWWGSTIPNALIAAASTVDPNFKVMLMPDMNASLKSTSPQELAAEMAQYATAPSVFKLDDGRLVISPFLAENKSPQWWTEFIAVMKDSYGIDVAFVPLFLDAAANMDAFAAISYGYSNWGNRSPAGNPLEALGPTSPRAAADKAHAMGKVWMQPVSFQDVRPNQSIYDEANNSQNLRDTWNIALESDSEWVQLTTWNDYSEGTAFAPSEGHGRALLDLNAYWLYWFRTGEPPVISRDTAYLIYRSQLVGAVPSNPPPSPMVLRPGSSPVRDTVEVVTAVRGPSTVTVTIGDTSTSCEVPAGIGTCVVPAAVGSVVATVSDGTSEIARVSAHREVSAAPYNQNLEYLVDSSRR
ncbi:glycoside hydrolase family 71 protein [Rhodococcus sp. IEGM 1409]|uniref:glycoside hydrolase family 71 protein n=1 Tax=Rhodococcus sp. IEGM 1409 TaxID=3047082 RepID=UPI0024B66FCD|nr:glycoside hydrolase family 71 protein [Rhodococcus sp. IEGM 1409]MDI9898524.1 glycoside hydrolase family 71 protein [Rhodococcus sp. IEGM 1409]